MPTLTKRSHDLRPAPRRLAHEVERRQIALWLASTANVPLRVLCAPIGFGKTVAILQYVDCRAGATAYVQVPAGADASELRALVAAADAEEVVLDGVDRAETAACEALVDDVLESTLSRRIIFVGRSRRRLRVHAALARGLAAACDAGVFGFDAGELAALAGTAGVAHDQDGLAQLLYDTEGWPLVAHWLIRDAAEGGRSLADAFGPWRDRNAHLLFEFLQHERYEDADAFEAFARMLADGWEDARHELERLEQLGLPIVRLRGTLRPYRILTRLAAPAEAQHLIRKTVATAPLMMVTVLGRFRCEIAGQPVVFARRRDQQVLVYVATAPEGRTSRDQLLDAFWPGVERSVAGQGLRTTLSRIRRSIAQAVPGVDPERYFRTAGELAIDTRAVAVDLRRFVDHVEQGRLDDARGNVEGAKHHYRVAHRLYVDRMLASDGPEPCLDARVEQFETMYVEVLTRRMALAAATGELEPAREYARELLARNTEDARRRAFSVFGDVPPEASAS